MHTPVTTPARPRSAKAAAFVLMFLLAVGTCRAAGVRVTEPFSVRPGKGMREYHLHEGEEFRITGLGVGTCRISYPLAPGVFVDLEIPQDKIEFLAKTKVEIAEEERRQAQREFEERQRAKGLVKLEEAWLTPEQHDLTSEVQRLYRQRDLLDTYAQAAARREQEAAGVAEEVTALKAQLAEVQKRALDSSEQLEQDLQTMDTGSRREIREHNRRVLEHNDMVADASTKRQRCEELSATRDEKQKALANARDNHAGAEQDYVENLREARTRYVRLAQAADADQRRVLEPYGRAIAELTDAVLDENRPQRATSAGMFVKAILDDELEASLLVDTGASYVLISDTMAIELGLAFTDANPQAELLTASGVRIVARLVTLGTVSVGAVEIRDVEVAVVPDHKEFMPLLGMSFLRRCKWHYGDSGAIIFD